MRYTIIVLLAVTAIVGSCLNRSSPQHQPQSVSDEIVVDRENVKGPDVSLTPDEMLIEDEAMPVGCGNLLNHPAMPPLECGAVYIAFSKARDCLSAKYPAKSKIIKSVKMGRFRIYRPMLYWSEDRGELMIRWGKTEIIGYFDTATSSLVVRDEATVYFEALHALAWAVGVETWRTEGHADNVVPCDY